jgi:hypothetical protein
VVRFVPPAPLDAATLGGAFFTAFRFESVPCRGKTSQFLCGSLRFSSLLFHCCTSPCYALLCLAMPCYSIASLCFSLPCRRETPPCQTIALPFNAIQFTSLLCQCAVAMPCHARLSVSIAAHGESERFRCCSVPRFTYPLLCRSRHCYAMLFHCNTLPSQALPSQCRARLAHATPSRYSISSQRNLPFPLFRHWPMPEKRP